MRKVLSFVLVLSLVLGSFSMAFAAEETKSVSLTDLKGKTYEEAANSLVDLGVITGMGDGTFGGDKEITRAQMAAMICKALGLSEAGANTFKDAKNHWAKSWIGLAQSLGVITGYADGTFKPDANVTYYEALAMIIKALGYDDNSLTGTWPNKYITQAQRLGISDDVTISAANANRGDIATMVYNSLGLQVGTTNKDGDWVGTEKLVNNVKTPVTLYTLLGATTVADMVILGSEEATISLTPFVGKFVTPIENKDGDIIAIKEVKSTTIVGDSISGTKIKDTNDVEYDFAGANFTGAAVGYAAYIYNGEAHSMTSGSITAAGSMPSLSSGVYSATGKVSATSTFEVKLSGNTITNVYSATKWEAPAANTFKFGNGMIDGYKFNGFNFPTEKDGKTIDATKYELKGADALDKIVKDNIVTIYTKADQKTIKRVAVGTKVVEGKVTAITSDSKKYTVAGTQYSLNNRVATDSAINGMTLGSTVKISLDNAGKIAFVDSVANSSGNYAIVLGTKAAITGMEEAQVKLLNKAGDEIVLTAKNSSISGDITGVTIGQAVRYSVNSAGKMDEFVKLTLLPLSNNKMSASGTLLGGMTIGSNAVVFSYDGTDFALSKIADVKKDAALTGPATITGYTYDGESKIQLIVVDKQQAKNSKATFAVINDVSQAYNSDNEKVQYVIGFADGKEFKAYTDANNMFTLGVQYGLFELDVDADGVITATAGGTDITTYAAFYTPVTVTAIDGNLLKVTGTAVAAGGQWVALDKNVVVYEYDGDEDEYIVKSSGTITNNCTITLYQTDEDAEQYDVVIIQSRP